MVVKYFLEVYPMIFEAQGNNIVIVELTNEEMKEYSVTYDLLGSDNAESESAVCKILAKARKMRGENGGQYEKVTVEALPGADGGCFFIFTFSERKRRYRVKKAAAPLLLEAENINGILDFRKAAERLLAEKCRLYEYSGKYYMLMKSPEESAVRLMTEFGTVRGGVYLNRLFEYGQFIGEI